MENVFIIIIDPLSGAILIKVSGAILIKVSSGAFKIILIINNTHKFNFNILKII